MPPTRRVSNRYEEWTVPVVARAWLGLGAEPPGRFDQMLMSTQMAAWSEAA